MGRTKPAAAGGTPVSAAEQLAALEAELAAAGPLDPTDEQAVTARLALDAQADELRTAARREADEAREAELGVQEAANFAAVHVDLAEAADEPAAAPAATLTTVEEADRA